MNLRTFAFTLLALIAFASNSLLTRLALGAHEIDAATFTAIRLCAGAVVLALLVRSRAGSWAPLRGRSITGALALFAYAAPFSFAYVRIGAAVGALVLFGVVQLTMIGYGLFRGERPSVMTWVGIVLATSGLALLTVPAFAQPDPVGLLLMAVAGVAWGVYSLAGRTAPDPIAANARSFLWSSPLALLIVAVSQPSVGATTTGIALAVVSGAVTSGLGYAIWYRALPRLTVTQAAVAQLAVPVIAAVAAVALLHELPAPELLISGVAVLSGVAVVLLARTGGGRQWLALSPALVVLLIAGTCVVPNYRKQRDRTRTRQTTADLASIGSALESRATDMNGYPRVATLEEAAGKLEPAYIKRMPRVDAWGQPYRYFAVDCDATLCRNYYVVSGGRNMVFDTPVAEYRQNRGDTPRVSDDLVATAGLVDILANPREYSSVK
jgi:drug/metabolite transporter (DMT)-like permease